MHHLYPSVKGDPLCPLGFHPQVRWPTRCKRCFRDYKEHGGKKKDDDFTSSSPSLSSWNSPSSRGRDEVNGIDNGKTGRSWSSSQNLSSSDSAKEKIERKQLAVTRSKTSWTSTPDLGDEGNAVTFSLKLPTRRQTGPLPLDTGQTNGTESSVTIKKTSTPINLTINKNDSLAERVRKMQLLKAQNSFEKETNGDKERDKEKRSVSRSREEEKTKEDVNFLIQVKSAKSDSNTTRANKPPLRGGPSKDSDLSDDESTSFATITDTDTTLVGADVRKYKEEIESLQNEIETLKKRCEKIEKEKSDILLRRLANLDTANSKMGRSSEVLKLQQKVNEQTTQIEDLRDEKKSLSLRIREMEAEIQNRPSLEAANRQIEQLRNKLLSAETLCEELMDENEDMKNSLRELEEEIDEMQDNFREDQADEYTVLRREIEQTTKNCRVLSFKLKKSEKRAEQLEQEKAEQEKKLLELAGGKSGIERLSRIKELEQELSRSNEVASRLQKELQEANSKLNQQPPVNQKRNPTLGMIGRSQSTDVVQKVSRASLTRGGSQEEPQQLLRDLQDSLEREADLREQLRNAEEEANNLRKRASRVEDDNESLLLQLKKMATKARTRKLSPTPPTNRLSIESSIEKDEGISDEEDPAELRILLELNEQEAAVLRRKVEEYEQESESLKRQVKELTDKLSSTPAIQNSPSNTFPKKNLVTKNNASAKPGSLADEKVKVLEDEIAELRIKLIEKERTCKRLHAELSVTQKKSKASLIKSNFSRDKGKNLTDFGSLDSPNDGQNFDLKRQLQVIEQEANVLRTKTQTLEVENEQLLSENKKLQLLRGTKTLKSDQSGDINSEKVSKLEKDLEEALSKLKELEAPKEPEKKRFGLGKTGSKKDDKENQQEFDKLKLNYSKLEKENKKLNASLKELKDDAIKIFKQRTPKKPTDLTTKLQLKKMVEDLESEIGEMYVIMKNAQVSISGVNKQQQLVKDVEDIRSQLSRAESSLNNEKNKLQTEIAELTESNKKLETEKASLTERIRKSDEEMNYILDENKQLQEDKKKLDNQVNKLCNDLKASSTRQTAMSDCMKKIEELNQNIINKDKEIEKLKKLVETNSKLEQDKNKLIKEVGDKTKKIGELEKKLKDTDDKAKRAEKQLNIKKERVTKLEKELSQEKELAEEKVTTQRRLSLEYITEKDELQTRLFRVEGKLISLEAETKERNYEYESKIMSLESDLAAKEFHIKQLEDTLRETSNQKYDEAVSSLEMAQMKEKLESTLKDLELKENELSLLKEERDKFKLSLEKLQEEFDKIKKEFTKLQSGKVELENNVKAQKKEAEYWESKASEFETDLQAERKKTERIKINHDKDIKNKESELTSLRGRLRTLEQTAGAGAKKVSELKQEFEDSIKKLQHELAVAKQDYDDLTGRYEVLEEEHVVTKARLTIEKENAQGQLLQVQKELNAVSIDLKSLQDTYNDQTDAWIKERNELQDEISSLEDRLCGGGWEVEKARLTAKLEKLEKEILITKQARDVSEHQMLAAKRELEDVKQKLDDYEKVHKVQRNLAAGNANLEQQIKTLHSKLQQAEQAKKLELSENKQRHEAQMQNMQDEIKSLQGQVTRFRRERDTYKKMVDTASKTPTEPRTVVRNSKRGSISSCDEEEWKNIVASLEQQVCCLEEELCESRAVTAKLRTDLVTEKADSELRLADMQSKVNELEEDRLLNSGGARISGAGTRMELAWQRERDDLQRLLRDTSTLARDLRQTLLEMERERDKERLDHKRRIDQLKKTNDEENEENKKKITELQCDLLELRDAHAKLRTTNEKLRRDRERHERERDQQRMFVTQLKKAQSDDDRKINYLLEQIDSLISQYPQLQKVQSVTSPSSLLTPTPPRRNRSISRSREATPDSTGSDANIQNTLLRLQHLTNDIKSSRFNDRQRSLNTGRRAMSIEPREIMTITPQPTRYMANRAPSLKKRSISLEQTSKDTGLIWKSVDEGSVSSIQSIDDEPYTKSSMDSRLSGGSTQSDVLPEKKKKQGLFGKLKKLTKSRSIDDQADVPDFKPIGTVARGQQPCSDSDMSTSGSKRDLKGRLSDMFKKNSGSRANSGSKELNTPPPSQRTITTRTLKAESTMMRSDTSIHKTRAASATPAMMRRGM